MREHDIWNIHHFGCSWLCVLLPAAELHHSYLCSVIPGNRGEYNTANINMKNKSFILSTKKSSYLGLKEDTMSILSHSIMFFVGSQDISGLHPEELVLAVQETSMKRLVVGPLDIRLHSSAAHRILKMITCAMDHEYEPYCKPQQGQSSLLNM